ncbi:MAG TPA: sugar-binding transcriptional regulator [Symbiobacteriaceae bacterium]
MARTRRIEERLLVEIAHLYYEEDLTQNEIAKRLGLSRPKVSRLLKEAKEKGLVKILILDPHADLLKMEKELAARFGLRAVRVVPTPALDDLLIKQAVAQEAADFIPRFLEPGDTIGVSWGSSLGELVRVFPVLPLPGSMVVQLNGGIDSANTHNNALDVVQGLAERLGAEAYTLPCPDIVGSPRIRAAFLQDERLARVLALGRSATKALVSVGALSTESVLVKAGYFSPEDIAALKAKGAVGDICSRYFDGNGRVCDPELDARTIGLSLEELRRIPCVIALAAGVNKGRALLGALRGGYCDILITDAATAQDVLAQDQMSGPCGK